MMNRIKAAWAALHGQPVMTGTGLVAVTRNGNGDFNSVHWAGMTNADAAKVLYQAADAVTNVLFAGMEKKTVH